MQEGRRDGADQHHLVVPPAFLEESGGNDGAKVGAVLCVHCVLNERGCYNMNSLAHRLKMYQYTADQVKVFISKYIVGAILGMFFFCQQHSCREVVQRVL